MHIKTYIDKSNTIVQNSNTNTSLNPIVELFFGGNTNVGQFTRHIFHFDETRLVNLYTGGTFTDLTKLKHTLKMTNTGSFDSGLLNGTYDAKDRATSFDLICFKIDQFWDSGVGYDYSQTNFTTGANAYSNSASNWVSAQTGIPWSGGSGIYSGSPSGITISTQHFDKGNENLEMDITNYVNGLLTGNTNYGLGIAYARPFEQMVLLVNQYVGFFSRETQTFYQPYIETTYSNHINDDRADFYLNRNNKLYLYVSPGGQPTNLDAIPSVNVFDQTGALFSGYSSSAVTNVTKGVYSIDIIVPDNGINDCTMYNDVWTGITLNGVSIPNVSLDFVMKDSAIFYNIGGSNDVDFSNNLAISISGIQNREKIKRNDIRKVNISARIPFTVNQTQKITGMEYRIYVNEGTSQLTVIDFEQVELSTPTPYFLIDTASLIPNIYYIDIRITSNLEVITKSQVTSFEIINQVNSRPSQ